MFYFSLKLSDSETIEMCYLSDAVKILINVCLLMNMFTLNVSFCPLVKNCNKVATRGRHTVTDMQGSRLTFYTGAVFIEVHQQVI